MAEQNDREESIAIRALLARLAAAVLGSGDLFATLREVRAELGNEMIARALLEGGGGDFDRFAALVAEGHDPDASAIAVGGTGRPRIGPVMIGVRAELPVRHDCDKGPVLLAYGVACPFCGYFETAPDPLEAGVSRDDDQASGVG